MSKTYTVDALNVMTVDSLRDLCRNLGITGMSKKRKDIIIDAILGSQGTSGTVVNATKPVTASTPVVNSGKIESMIMTFTKKSGKIMVSCGANSGEFDVVGKAIYDVHEFLREVLNIPQDSSYTVSGSNVSLGYILKEGDTLEFIKKAGSKGCN